MSPLFSPRILPRLHSRRLLWATLRLLPLLGLGTAGVHGATNGSLWQAETLQEASGFGDRTGARPGDLITIVVRLSSSGSQTGKTKTDRENSVQDALTTLLFNARSGTTGDQAFNFYRSGGDAPSFNWAGTRAFQGGGSIDSKETFTTTLAARITEVSSGGVARVEARRVFDAGKEKSSLIITGFVRREDIGIDNSVESTRIADLQIQQEGSGPLSRDQEKGWLTKLLETVNPF